MASIRKRGDRQWEVRVRKRGHPVQCQTFTTKVKAEAWATIVESEMERGVFVSRAEAETTTLTIALERYTREISSKKKSGNREIFTIRWWQASSLAPRFLASIRGKDIAAVLATQESEGAAPIPFTSISPYFLICSP